ncbi:MAG TPA: ADOP family duplicated permease, partial [Gemmatimonadales bacterium]|nr:ADOP family duplicated permease [Gemmatimonadales bacterium]
LAGRFYTADEDRIGGGPPVVVLSEQFWRRRFGGDPAVLGTSIRLGSTLFTVIGVAPRGFSGIELNRVDGWIPVGSGAREMLGPNEEWANTRNWEWVRVVGRLKPDAVQQAVESELTTTYRGAIAGDPERNQNATMRLHSIIAGRGPEAPQSTRIALWLAGVSFVVLLITCANVANLLLARGTRRQREMAVRLALGIRRRRLVGELLLESLILAVLGGGLALLAAQWGGAAIRNFLMPDIDWVGPPVDARVVAAASLATLITLIAAGLLPAIQTSRPDLTVALKAGSQAAGRDPRHARLRRALLVVQTALSVLLLSGAGLFVRSLQNVARLDLGFEPHGLLVAAADVSGSNLSREERIRLAGRLLDAVRDFPGVASASLGIMVPFQTRYSTELRLPGRDSLPALPTGNPSYNGVSPGFFETTGMRLVQGRPFGEGDSEHGAPVMIVNESMARTFWPGENPIGRCVMIGGDSVPPCFQVVGVVADARRAELREDPTMQYFVPEKQALGIGLSSDRSLYLRVTGDQDAMVEPLRRAIIAAAPEVAWVQVTPMDSFLEPHVQPWRLGASMFGIFGLLALLVAAVGLYGVMAYSVVTRTREFGVRGALGASSGALAGQVLREGLRLTSLGLAIGAGAALGVASLIASLLFETPARDPVVLTAVSGLLLAVALLASLIPAWRAARTAPADALRGE